MKERQRRALGLILALVILVSLGLPLVPTADAAGTGAADAEPPASGWQSLAAGDSHWYAFQYKGDGSQVEVRLQVEPSGSVGFVVWTPELIERWGQGYRVEPIGRSSDDPYAEGQVVWTGSFTTASTYYVVVEGASGQPGSSYYLLEVSGEGVAFAVSSPATADAATADAAASTSSQVTTQAADTSGMAGKLVFQTTFGGAFYTINVDGTGLQRITDGIDPVWSPDGEQIAFVRWVEPRGVWVANVVTGDEWRVFDWSSTRYPAWSPDGAQLVFSRQTGSSSPGVPLGGFALSGTSDVDQKSRAGTLTVHLDAATRPPSQKP